MLRSCGVSKFDPYEFHTSTFMKHNFRMLSCRLSCSRLRPSKSTLSIGDFELVPECPMVFCSSENFHTDSPSCSPRSMQQDKVPARMKFMPIEAQTGLWKGAFWRSFWVILLEPGRKVFEVLKVLKVLIVLMSEDQ